MENYIELIFKKKKYIEKLRKEKDEIDRELICILDEQKVMGDKNANHYQLLNHYEYYEREYTINAAVLAVGALFLVASLVGLPFLAFLNINLLLVIVSIFGLNMINLLVCFSIVGITKNYYQNKRNKYQEEIALIKERINLVNEQVQEIRIHYEEMISKSKLIVLQIIKEEKDIERIKQVIINSLLKASNKELEVLKPILDSLIEKEITSNTKLDTNINRIRTLD